MSSSIGSSPKKHHRKRDSSRSHTIKSEIESDVHLAATSRYSHRVETSSSPDPSAQGNSSRKHKSKRHGDGQQVENHNQNVDVEAQHNEVSTITPKVSPVVILFKETLTLLLFSMCLILGLSLFSATQSSRAISTNLFDPEERLHSEPLMIWSFIGLITILYSITGILLSCIGHLPGKYKRCWIVSGAICISNFFLVYLSNRPNVENYLDADQDLGHVV